MSVTGTGSIPTEDELVSSLEVITSELQNLHVQSAEPFAQPRHSSETLHFRRSSKNLSAPMRPASTETHRAISPLTRPNHCMENLETHKNAVFLFADMQGYTIRSQEMTPENLFQLLNEIYTDFLAIVERVGAAKGIETVKFTGDCIMLAASSIDDTEVAQQAKAMLNVGWHLAQYISRVNETRREDPINFRFGINVGPATKVKMRFNNVIDWIGEGVNKASRMESSSVPNQIQITESVYGYIAEDFDCSPCIHAVKDYKSPTTFFVVCPKIRASSSQTSDASQQAAPTPLDDAHFKRKNSMSQPALSSLKPK